MAGGFPDPTLETYKNIMNDYYTRFGYVTGEDDPPSDLRVFIRDADGPETRIYCSQSEVEDFERDMADGESPLLSSDTLIEDVFDTFKAWLQENAEGGVKTLDEWHAEDGIVFFASNVNEKYRESLLELRGPKADLALRRINALEVIANLYAIKL